MKCSAVGCGRPAADGRIYCAPSCEDKMQRRLARAREHASHADRPDALLDELGITNVSCRKVLAVLRHGPATTLELHQAAVGGLGAKQRMYDLRQAGFVITSEHINRKNHLFTLVSEPSRGARVEETPACPDDQRVPSHADRQDLVIAAPASPAPGPTAPLALFGCHHVCDWCGHRWSTEKPHPAGCPECHRGAHWLASHATSDAAERYVPLCDAPAKAS